MRNGERLTRPPPCILWLFPALKFLAPSQSEQPHVGGVASKRDDGDLSLSQVAKVMDGELHGAS